MNIWIDSNLCNNCKKCVKSCPYQAIKFDNNYLQICDRCTECGVCVEICVKKAIIGNKFERVIPDFSKYKNIWVYLEYDSKGVKKISKELLSKARDLANLLEEKVVGLILGSKISSFNLMLTTLGMDYIFILDNINLKNYDSEIYANQIKKIIKENNPNIFLFGATYLGRDLAPRIAKLINSGLTADCTDLDIDNKSGLLIQTRPAFGGNLLATIVNKFSKPQMATVRSGVFKENEFFIKKNTEIKYLKHNVKVSNIKILKKVYEKSNILNIENAKIIFAGGRGMDVEGFKLLYNLAKIVGGKVGGTRIAVEKGWISENQQIGQTGLTVSPKLYFACGISGAIQHRAGIYNSNFIIAINKDQYAPIFKISNLGIVGDVFKILPALINLIKNSKI